MPSFKTVDLHGSPNVEEAVSRLHSELYQAYIQKETLIRVVYGIGTGRLRQAVLVELGRAGLVKSFNEEEGGASVLVRL